jgi:hypothetical protein
MAQSGRIEVIARMSAFRGIALQNSLLRCERAETNDVERVLTDIHADYGNRTLCCRSHGVLLVLAPLASLSLAGQQHGRTIPLADIGRDRRSRDPHCTTK